MQNKLQELTEKIYQEGISKGNAEAEIIISDAKNEAKTILTNAKKEAEKLLTDAKKKSEEIKSNAEAELKLSSKQAINSLKQGITNLINDSIVNSSVSKAFDDDTFVKKIIELSVNKWDLSSDENIDISILIPENEEKKLSEYFIHSAKKLLDRGMEIKPVSDLKKGFQISPKDGSYKISFTDDDFVNFFKQYLRPKLIELLFGE